MNHLPRLKVPPVPDGFNGADEPASWNWNAVPKLRPFVLADGNGTPLQQTVAHVCYDLHTLFVRFDCHDRDIWGTFTERDDPIYDEEVVELFLAPGGHTPVDYYEFEVSPNGVLLDVKIHNSGDGLSDVKGDFSWNCPGLRWAAQRKDAGQTWWAAMAVPWASVGAQDTLPELWRANLYRIERPRDASPEFSCWSPTMSDPADFHRPQYFGYFELTHHE